MGTLTRGCSSGAVTAEEFGAKLELVAEEDGVEVLMGEERLGLLLGVHEYVVVVVLPQPPGDTVPQRRHTADEESPTFDLHTRSSRPALDLYQRPSIPHPYRGAQGRQEATPFWVISRGQVTWYSA